MVVEAVGVVVGVEEEVGVVEGEGVASRVLVGVVEAGEVGGVEGGVGRE